ncbi:MAG: 30S ribosomal protein S3 [Myxococcota bacterium]
MGQKVNPVGIRLKITRSWDSKWFASKEQYKRWLHEDLKIKAYVKKKLENSAISKVEIERASNKIKISIYTARPGFVIGKKGAGIDELANELKKLAGKDTQININIMEVRKAETDAQLIAENVAGQLERRVNFRRAMKKAVQTCLKFGAKGVKIRCGGRLGGAEMARHEWYREGKVPLQTFRADIDYGFAIASTTYGVIGVKCWVYKGEVLEKRG